MKLPFALNPALEKIHPYQPGRPIEEVAREMGLSPRGIIKLASNENPLGPSRMALAAIKTAGRHLHLYPDGNAYYFRQKLAAKLRVKPENLILGNGSNDILEFLAHAVVGPGVDVVMSQYGFLVYPLVTRLLGGNPVVVPAKNFGHDLPAMLAAVTPQTRLMFVGNPNNPTGTLAKRQEVVELIEKTPAHVIIAMDEAYIEFLEKPPDLLPLVRSGKRPNLILLRTFSKIYGLAGLRLGYGIGHPEFMAALEKIRQPFNVNSLAQAAGLAALDDRAHLERTRKNNFQGRRYLENAFRDLCLDYIPSSANFILVKVGHGARVFEELQRKGIIVRPMGGYGLPDHVRISIGRRAENRRCALALKNILGR